VRELAAQISADYAGREIDLVCLAHSAMMFTGDLVRHITVPVKQHALAFSSYPQPSSSGEVRLTLDVAEPLQGRHVLRAEGMVISGRTPPVSDELVAPAPARKS
jgi:hypoxanthine phosphoribosyltransferase